MATVREKPGGPEQPAQVHDGHPAGRDLVAQRVAPHGRERHRHGAVSVPPNVAECR